MKYYNKFLSMLLTVIGSVYTAKAQIKPLSIGTQMPDITFTKTINFQSSNVKISDYKGKLIILDFWATWCSPCVAAIPKMDSLQRKFNDSVVFLPVTYQDKTIVSPFADRVLKNDKIVFRSIVSDTILNKMFPHTSIPFFVWIDKNGKIVASTDATEINVSDIRKVLQGNSNIKNRPMRNYRAINIKQPVIMPAVAYEDAAGEYDMEVLKPEQILFQSVLTKYNENLRGKSHYDSAHYVEINTPIINFYRSYFGAAVYKKNPFIFWSKSRCRIEIADTALSNKINSDKKGAGYLNWSVSNAYCYELKWQGAVTWADKFALLKDDIDRYFSIPLGIEAVMEKRMVLSDVLVRVPSSYKLKTDGKIPNESHDAYYYKQNNLPISALINRLESYYWQMSDRPVFDETHLTERCDLDLECDMNDINQVNKALLRYGLKFISAERMADVLIIRKKDEQTEKR